MSDSLFHDAPDAAQIGRELIASEKEFEHLNTYHIVYVFSEKTMKRGERTVCGTAEVVRGKNAFLYWQGREEEGQEAFFRLTFSQMLWKFLTAEQKRFVVRHELRHCGKKWSKAKREEVIYLKPHDFELFRADLNDPSWKPVCDIWEAVKAASEQTSLPLDDEGIVSG